MSHPSNQNLASALGVLLADSYILGLKTQNYHWNVVGPEFVQLHQLFGDQYQALATAIDRIAERIRALGYPAPASFEEFSGRSRLKSAVGAPATREMIAALCNDHRSAAQSAYAAIEIAEECGDSASADLAVGRVDEHEKAAWMLTALLS